MVCTRLKNNRSTMSVNTFYFSDEVIEIIWKIASWEVKLSTKVGGVAQLEKINQSIFSHNGYYHHE